MTTYDLYLESGPRRRKTMVHVLGLLGCVATGPTTEAALEATPEAIHAFLRFLHRHDEARELTPADTPDTPFTVRIVEHIVTGQWLGNGSPYLVFGPDLEPVPDAEVERLLRRFDRLRQELADWAKRQTEAQLDAPPAGGGRPARAVLLHVLGAAVGGYLSAALGSAPGFSAIAGATERGEIDLAEGLRRIVTLTEARVRATTAAERNAVREHNGQLRTLRKALRRTLEHDWEHLAELARRPGGPQL